MARINQLVLSNEELGIRLNAQNEHNLQLQRDVNELLRIRELDQVEIQALEEQLMEQSQTIEKLLPKPKVNVMIQTQPDPQIVTMQQRIAILESEQQRNAQLQQAILECDQSLQKLTTVTSGRREGTAVPEQPVSVHSATSLLIDEERNRNLILLQEMNRLKAAK